MKRIVEVWRSLLCRANEKVLLLTQRVWAENNNEQAITVAIIVIYSKLETVEIVHTIESLTETIHTFLFTLFAINELIFQTFLKRYEGTNPYFVLHFKNIHGYPYKSKSNRTEIYLEKYLRCDDFMMTSDDALCSNMLWEKKFSGILQTILNGWDKGE